METPGLQRPHFTSTRARTVRNHVTQNHSKPGNIRNQNGSVLSTAIRKTLLFCPVFERHSKTQMFDTLPDSRTFEIETCPDF